MTNNLNLELKSLVLWAFGWRPAWLQHLLHNIEADTGARFIFHNSQMIKHVKMSQVRGKCVSVLVGQPLPLCSVCMTRANVLGLEMLQLAVNIIAVTHC